MTEKNDAEQRVAEIDERLRSIESGADQADAAEVDSLTEEREDLLNRSDDNTLT